jgi:hypothetical protein
LQNLAKAIGRDLPFVQIPVATLAITLGTDSDEQLRGARNVAEGALTGSPLALCGAGENC